MRPKEVIWDDSAPDSPKIRIVPSPPDGFFVVESEEGTLAVKEIDLSDVSTDEAQRIEAGDTAFLGSVMLRDPSEPWSYTINNMYSADGIVFDDRVAISQVFLEYVPFREVD
jgi:hypothetical protein